MLHPTVLNTTCHQAMFKATRRLKKDGGGYESSVGTKGLPAKWEDILKLLFAFGQSPSYGNI